MSPTLICVVGASAFIVAAAQLESRRLRRRLVGGQEGTPRSGGIGGLLRPYRLAVAWAIAVDVVAVLAGLAAPWPVKAVVDSITGTSVSSTFEIAGSHHVVVAAVVIGVGLVGVMCTLDYLSAVLGETIGANIALDLRRSVLSHLIRLPIRTVSSHRTGDIVTRLTTDVNRFQQANLERWRELVPNVLAMVGMVMLMAILSPVLAAVTALLAPLTGLAFWVRRHKVSQAQRVSRTLSGDLAARISELARSISAVQTFGREDDERTRMESTGRSAALASIRAVIASARLAPFADVIVALNLAIVLLMGARQVHSHQLSVGGLVVFLTYLGAIQQPVRSLSRLSRTLGSGVASRERLEAVLHQPELPVSPNPLSPAAGAPVVAAHHVRYSYGDGRPALRDVTLCLPSGRITAILGTNGAGKTTLLQLLMRLDDPDSGTITVDGVDIRDYDLAALRRSIAFVPQEVWLTDGTLLENVAYGNPTATAEEVLGAARLALVDEIADRLPHGWSTELGEGGTALSGGERRRVAIARAVLRDCPVLLLDEPTLGLDSHAERFVIDAIRSAAAGRTTVIVTHSPQLAAIAAQIVCLDNGRVLDPVPIPDLDDEILDAVEPIGAPAVPASLAGAVIG